MSKELRNAFVDVSDIIDDRCGGLVDDRDDKHRNFNLAIKCEMRSPCCWRDYSGCAVRGVEGAVVPKNGEK